MLAFSLARKAETSEKGNGEMVAGLGVRVWEFEQGHSRRRAIGGRKIGGDRKPNMRTDRTDERIGPYASCPIILIFPHVVHIPKIRAGPHSHISSLAGAHMHAP